MKCRWRKPTDTITEHLLARRATQQNQRSFPNVFGIKFNFVFLKEAKKLFFE